jgi:hypothetical protein
MGSKKFRPLVAKGGSIPVVRFLKKNIYVWD